MRKNAYNGRFIYRYLPEIQKLINQYKVKTLIDYGCGKGVQWTTATDGKYLKDLLGLEDVYLFDPGTKEYAKDPTEKADMVICTQVIGNIPKVDAAWFLGRLQFLSNKCVFIGERTELIKKNVHAPIKDYMIGTLSHQQLKDLVKAHKRKVPTYICTHGPDFKNKVEKI